MVKKKMLGLLRPYIENFNLNRYPHEFPPEANPLFTEDDLNTSDYSYQNSHMDTHGHIKNYMTKGKGYTTLYDVGVYIILIVFLGLVCREVLIMFPDEKNKTYMFLCIIIIICSAVLY